MPEVLVRPGLGEHKGETMQVKMSLDDQEVGIRAVRCPEWNPVVWPGSSVSPVCTRLA